MFSKAPIKRCTDIVQSTPGPSDYDPKEVKSKGAKIADVRAARFTEPKITTPGPGTYDNLPASAKNSKKSLSTKPKTNLSRGNSRTSSTTSLNVNYLEADEEIHFKTPIKLAYKKLAAADDNAAQQEVVEKLEMKSRNHFYLW